MEALTNYLIQSGLCLLLFYVFYLLVLRNSPRLGFNRLYLLLTPVVAFIIPLLNIPLPFVPSYTLVPVMPAMQLPELTVTSQLPQQQTPVAKSIPIGFILAIVYTLAVMALLFKLGAQLLRLRRLVTSATPLRTNDSGATVLQVDEIYPTFAFLNYIFLNNQTHLSEQEKQQVIAHELAHVRLRHTYDVLYYEILSAILWFNPLVWLLKAELRDVHEYQADADVISVYQPQAYTSLLAKEALYRTGIPVGSYFQKPQVFKRLQMLQKYNQKPSLLRPLLVLPLLLLILLIFSSKDVTADIASKFTSSPAPEVVEQNISFLEEESIAKPAEEAPTEVIVTAPVSDAPAIEVVKTPKKQVIKEEETESIVPEAEKPYMYVEQMPQFKGGELELQKFIARNIRYPKTTQEAGITGLVVASFVVEKDGSLTDIAILRGLDEAADKEAIRVIEEMNGKWEAGSQNGQLVPVRYTIPIRFALIN
jgi:TonB family protein